LSLAQIDGSWNLLSWSSTAADGAVSYPYSEAAAGRIIFDTKNLRMAAFMMHPDWKNNAGEQRMFLSYSAAIELTIDMQHGNVLLHHVDFASNPRMIGETLRRKASLEGNVLTLKTLTTLGREPSGGHHTLVWQRETMGSESRL
jgi:hypothetical protein